MSPDRVKMALLRALLTEESGVIIVVITMIIIIINIIIIIIIIIIMTAFKGAVRDFVQSPPLRRELSPTRTLKWPRRNPVQIMCNTSSVYQMQLAVYHLVRRDSSAVKFNRVEMAFISVLFYWLKPLTDEGGEEARAPGQKH